MQSNEIRQSFLDYYTKRGHTLLPSASLVPVADPTLLLINAGMAPLKRYFMGQDAPPAARCCNSQKCVRTIDIDQVGRTNRHNTFFEMLGKWSFGDYFKRQAMQYTLEWYTSREWLGLDTTRLYITHHEKDEETRDLWVKELGWPADRLFGLGDKDNLWAAGDTGPWGYDTEYFWDFEPDSQPVDKARFLELCNHGRIVEIGNDVFMQFSRDETGNNTELPSRNVDFGGGLERMSMVLQDKRTAYNTDCFDYLIRGFADVIAAGTRSGAPAEKELFELGPAGFNPYWLAADHIRTATFLLGDGVTPGNVGRNYVLRRLIRRIIAQAYRLGIRKPFILSLADLVIDKLGGHYTDLRQNRESIIVPWISKEEEQFFKVMETGYGRLAEKIEVCLESRSPMPGEYLFELYDTYGFPFDIAREICEEQNVDVMEDAFERAMSEQKTRARGAARFEGTMGEQETHKGEVRFAGYSQTAAEATVLAVDEIEDIGKLAPLVATAAGAQPGLRVTTDITTFYSNAGGQPDDTGWLLADGLNYPAQSSSTRGTIVVSAINGQLPSIEPGSNVVVAVDTQRRNALRRPHTTTHLMLGAMKQVLGEHIRQAGSQLDEDVIRFDFSHFEAVKPEQLRRIEEIVNRWILEDHAVGYDEMTLVQAKAMGVTAVFDEKYGNVVRVVSVGEGSPDRVDDWVSRELCGGTHLDHTAQAGQFMVVKEESVQSGVRRIYALTGYKALGYVGALRSGIDRLGTHYKRPIPIPVGANAEEYAAEVQGWLEETFGKISDAETKLRDAHQAAVEARRELALGSLIEPLKAQSVELGGFQVLCTSIRLSDRADLKYLVERFAGGVWLTDYVVFVAAAVDGKAALAAKCSPSAVARGVKAVELIKLAASITGGGGGGRDDYAEAGGKDESKTAAAAEAVRKHVGDWLAAAKSA